MILSSWSDGNGKTIDRWDIILQSTCTAAVSYFILLCALLLQFHSGNVINLSQVISARREDLQSESHSQRILNDAKCSVSRCYHHTAMISRMGRYASGAH